MKENKLTLKLIFKGEFVLRAKGELIGRLTHATVIP